VAAASAAASLVLTLVALDQQRVDRQQLVRQQQGRLQLVG
jgi:hypothetical protein